MFRVGESALVKGDYMIRDRSIVMMRSIAVDASLCGSVQ